MISDEDETLLQAVKKAGGAQGLDTLTRAFRLHDALFNHKELGGRYQALVGEAFPEVRTPAKVAAEVAAPYVSRLDDIDARFKKMDEEREAAAKAAAQNDFNASWNGVVKDYELTEEGQEKLESFMKTRKLADPEAAAALYFKQNPAPAAPVTPASVAPIGWGRDALGIAGDSADAKLLVSDPDAWADREAASVLTEVRREAA